MENPGLKNILNVFKLFLFLHNFVMYIAEVVIIP